MPIKLIVTLSDDMDYEDAAVVAEELQENDAVEEVEGMGFPLWEAAG